MKIGLLFWVIWVLCVLVWLGLNFGGMGPQYGRMAGGGAIDLILFGLIGWQIFGPVIQKGA
jgi:hypothetical protein